MLGHWPPSPHPAHATGSPGPARPGARRERALLVAASAPRRGASGCGGRLVIGSSAGTRPRAGTCANFFRGANLLRDAGTSSRSDAARRAGGRSRRWDGFRSPRDCFSPHTPAQAGARRELPGMRGFLVARSTPTPAPGATGAHPPPPRRSGSPAPAPPGAVAHGAPRDRRTRPATPADGSAKRESGRSPAVQPGAPADARAGGTDSGRHATVSRPARSTRAPRSPTPSTATRRTRPPPRTARRRAGPARRRARRTGGRCPSSRRPA